MKPPKHTHYADVNIQVRVYFSDDGDNDLTDQALEQVEMEMSLGELENHGLELVGGVQLKDHPHD